MIQYIELHPRLNLINGVPSSQAGEWPGIKPNKFPKTKKLIHIKETTNIFSLDDIYINKGKKRMIQPGLKEENPIKIKRKRIFSANNKTKSKTITNDIYPTPLQNYNRLVINREYDFEKRDKYYRMIQCNQEKKLKENELINNTKTNTLWLNSQENNPLKKFNNKFYENVSSNKNLGVTLTQELFRKYKNKIEKKKKPNNNIGFVKKRKVNSYKYLIDKKRTLEKKKEKEQLNYDINYVLSLDEKEYKARTLYNQNKLNNE